ncbi:HAD-IIB family hydrolase [Mycoplasmopsis gallinarum]|uniref:HAD-IIB family hydrolase n=1 Tax=Mycoplasmopsis gallinarum TaxID=29557 RepID=UPI000482AA38|nr:HAD-IIB family hydrolase [Mycoplasmopsis gallinarum]
MKKISKPQTIFIDLDGTTLDGKTKGKKPNYFSNENKQIINELKEQNINVVVSTGRGDLPKTWNILKTANSDQNCILWNGSKVYANGKLIFEKSISNELVVNIINFARRSKISTIVNSDFYNKTYPTTLLLKTILKLLKGKINRYSQFNYKEPIYKLIFMHKNKKNLFKFEAELKKLYANDLEIAFSGKNNSLIEVTAKNCSKGNAEKILSNYLNWDLNNSYHFGDSMNDASAKNVVNKLIAMKNASKNFKIQADFVSEFNYKKGGFAKTIKKYFEMTEE